MFTDFVISDVLQPRPASSFDHFPDLRHADHNAHLEALVTSQLAALVNGKTSSKALDGAASKGRDNVQ